MCRWLGTLFGWDIVLKSSLREDECFNDFQVSATVRDCWSIENKIKTDNKYFIVEFLRRRVFELKFTKDTV